MSERSLSTVIRSMTGHGEAKAESPEFEIGIEIRSVNNRFLRIVTKIGDNIAFLQAPIEAEVRKQVSRGSVYITVRFEPKTCAAFYDIDVDLVRKYHRRLNDLAAELHTGEAIRIADLLPLPGVVHVDETQVPDREQVAELSIRALADALALLEGMRRTEGDFLRREFRRRGEAIADLLRQARVLAPQAIAEYHRRLEERLNQALSQHEVTLAPDDLIKEVALLAERSDITEEITRLDSHLAQLGSTLDTGGTVGRKLEFIIQEMFREANTMASKTVHPGLNRLLVDFKAELDRLKEQVQNIE